MIYCCIHLPLGNLKVKFHCALLYSVKWTSKSVNVVTRLLIFPEV